MAYKVFYSPQVINTYDYLASGTALNEALLTNVTVEMGQLSTLITAVGPYTGDASVSGISLSMVTFSGALSGMYQHALDLFTNLSQKLGIYCTQANILYATSGITSGQIVTLTSGWFGTIVGFGQNILTSGSVYIAQVSAAVSGGIPALSGIASSVVSGFNTLTSGATGLTTVENAAYSGGLATALLLGEAGGFVAEFKNPGGKAVLSYVGTSGFVNGLG